MNPRTQRKTLDLIDAAPDIVTRNYWLLKTAIQDGAHPKIIARIRSIYEARLFLDKLEDEKDPLWNKTKGGMKIGEMPIIAAAGAKMKHPVEETWITKLKELEDEEKLD